MSNYFNVSFVGQVGVSPAFAMISTSDSLESITTAGWLDSKPIPEKPGITDLVMILYGFNPPSAYGTFSFFKVSVANGVSTLTQNYTGLTPSDPDITTVASVKPGSYAVGNLLVAGDTDGSVSPGAAALATQFRTIDDAILAADAALGVGMNLSAASLTSGAATGSYSNMEVVANAGAKVTAFTADVTATGNLGATSITSALTSVMSVGGNVMTAGAILTGHYIDADAPTNVTGSTANFCATYVKGPQTGSLGSLIALNGKSASLLNITDGGSMIATPAGTTPSGALRTFKVNIGGTDYQILAAVTYS